MAAVEWRPKMRFASFIGIFFIILVFFVANGSHNVDAAFWDGCAGVSQVKSIVQLLFGHKKDAIQTQKNFLNQMIIVSQAKSLYHVIQKDFKAARQTQKIFYGEMVEPFIDSTPALGHMKACVHLMLDDKDRALKILKVASRSTAIFIGAGVSGPAAAYLAGVLADAVITGIDSYKRDQYTPYGTLEYLRNASQLPLSRHFDMLADMVSFGKIGARYSNYRVTQNKKPFTRLSHPKFDVLSSKNHHKRRQPKKWYQKKLGVASNAKRKKAKDAQRRNKKKKN